MPWGYRRGHLQKIWYWSGERGIGTLVKPELVDSGPCKENIIRRKDVDLSQFPIPKLHAMDGGRYALTWHIVVTKDPDTGWVNVGTYRGMTLDNQNIGMLLSPFQNWGMHAEKYKKRNLKMPIAVAIGVDPVTLMTSTTPYPVGVNEYEVAGAIRQKPIQLVKCETNDLPVPANSEIVFEGEIDLDPSTYRQ